MTSAKPKQGQKKKPDKASPRSSRDTDAPETGVPAWAENMEHTLRRLSIEKAKRRSKNPGLYR